MSLTPPGHTETTILQMLLPRLEAEGFQVVLNPPKSVLPPFMKGYQPDAIALRDDKKVALKVKSRFAQAHLSTQIIRDMFSAHPDWELRIIYAPTQKADQPITLIPPERVLENLDRLLEIFDNAGSVPALLTGWSVFEAAARSVIPGNLQQPQMPERLLEVLASDGYITPQEADDLRNFAVLRNKAAHGQLDIAVSRDQIAALAGISRTLMNLAGSTA